MVVICDFRGSVEPEICKTRPVVVITPPYVKRVALTAVVPLSTTRPRIVRGYHVRLTSPPFSDSAPEVWAKCDLAASVSCNRLRRIRLRNGNVVAGEVCKEDLDANPQVRPNSFSAFSWKNFFLSRSLMGSESAIFTSSGTNWYG